MWCPKGYVTFLAIHHELLRLTKSVRVRAKNYYEEIYGCRLGIDESQRIEVAERIALDRCINEFFRNCSSLSVFSPSGTCLEINSRIAVHRPVGELSWQYVFIDKRTGLVSAAQFEHCRTLVNPRLKSIREQIDEFDEGSSDYSESYYSLSAIEDDAQFWEALKVFDGWAVGCLREDMPSNVKDFLSLDFDFDLTSLVVGGRLVEVSNDMKALIIDYHDRGLIKSKQDLWKDNFRNEKREAFRAAWAEAAKERPELSKRGPKQLF